LEQKILFITPPFTQLNTPYPATAYLKGFLNTKQVVSFQVDLGLEVILKIFSKEGFIDLFREIRSKNSNVSENAQRILNLQTEYIQSINMVIPFLQGKAPFLAQLICEGNFLPEASRFNQLDNLEWAFGTMGTTDKAKHLATLYLEDISDLIIETIDPHFGFSRYAEQLGRSANSFDELYLNLSQPAGYIENILNDLLKSKIELFHPTIVALSVPFPGNLLCALQCGKWIKQNHPAIRIALGGGFANTELRSIQDIRVFDFVDFITLDDGEAPLFHLIEHIVGKRKSLELKRTFLAQEGDVKFIDGSTDTDYGQKDLGTPDYSDLLLDKYISVIEIVNPMHRLWSDGRWNKLTLAHGCYWGRCTFCDTTLDYIKRFEPNVISLLCDRIEETIQQTGQHGFHFVDEAAPPALLRGLAIEIIRRKITLSWWTNIRFEKNFTGDLCRLLKESGCIAVSGGLEVASDRILKLINKGVSVSQVARVTDHFTQAGIMVHAYLMYGFPTQSVQETIDSLEIVRQLFMNGLVQSGFWHHFALTAHSPVGINPDTYQIALIGNKPATFANNDLQYIEKNECHHENFSEGLRKSIFNYMHGIGFEFPLQDWFEFKIPKTTIAPDYIHHAITFQEKGSTSPHNMVLWTGNLPITRIIKKSKKGKEFPMMELLFHTKKNSIRILMPEKSGHWLEKMIPMLMLNNVDRISYSQLEKEFMETTQESFDEFWSSKAVFTMRENGLLVI
jgi:hypothetical protein